MKKADSVKDNTFFTAKDGSKTTNYYVEDAAGSIYLLVNNEVVKVKLAKKDTDYTVVAHDFTKASGATYTFAADGTLATAKCATCGAVYTYTKYYTVADAAKDSVAIAANALYTGSPEGYLYTGSTTTPTTGTTSPPPPLTLLFPCSSLFAAPPLRRLRPRPPRQQREGVILSHKKGPLGHPP